MSITVFVSWPLLFPKQEMCEKILKNPPSISVVIPTYNAEKYINATLQSVIAQTFTDFEVLVVDDGSRDRTREIIAAMAEKDSRIVLYRMPKNTGGPAAPRNVGVRSARGTWVAFLDADDLWHPRKLEIQHKVLLETGLDLCCTQMVDFIDGAIPTLTDTKEHDIIPITFEMQLRKCRTPNSTMVVRRTLLLQNPFEESASYKALEDHHCWLRCMEAGNDCAKVMTPLMGYRLNENQISKSKWYMANRLFHILKGYKLQSGARIGNRAYLYICTHIILGVFYRKILRRL